VHKFADKWAKAGSNVWHERWGEDYDGRGACQKWTDKVRLWAQCLMVILDDGTCDLVLGKSHCLADVDARRSAVCCRYGIAIELSTRAFVILPDGALQWAERLLPGGGQEQWGDKWTETFGQGKGTKHGEVSRSRARHAQTCGPVSGHFLTVLQSMGRINLS
jgi:hypothetical protein